MKAKPALYSAMKSSSIARDLLRQSMLFIALIVMILGGSLSFLFYKVQREQSLNELQAANQSLTKLIENSFHEARSTITFLAQQDIVRNYTPSPQHTLKLESFYKSIRQSNNRIRYLYSGYEQHKTLVITDYIPPPNFDPTQRPWYRQAMQHAPDVSIGTAYQDINTQQWMVSTSKVLLNDNMKITGVVAFDINLGFIKDLLNTQHDIYKLAHSYVLQSEGKFLFHHDPSLIGKTLIKVNNLDKDVTFSASAGFYSYDLNGTRKIGYYNKLPENGWVVATVMDEWKLFTNFAWQAAACFALVLLGAASGAAWLAKTTAKKIITPLKQLKTQLECLTSGTALPTSAQTYPPNEIGDIASKVAQLAENELLSKAQALTVLNLALAEEKRKYKDLSNTDQLTGLKNRRFLDENLSHEFARFKRYGGSFAVLIVDVDYFKRINDTKGHLVGDKILIALAEELKSTVRNTDTLGRWGGEEFMILCPNADQEGALALGHKICEGVRNLVLPDQISVTVSIGIGLMREGLDTIDLIREADQSLYQAKKQGRDQYVHQPLHISAAE
jgi:diguanylate cyclase (GGDEF)-like protein